MGFLDTILEKKREEVLLRKKLVLRSTLEDSTKFGYSRLSLQKSLAEHPFAIIGEVKRPSRLFSWGTPYNPLVLSRMFVLGGACALTVVTDAKFYRGNLGDIETIRNFVTVPILQRDFIVDPYQLYEARSVGADAVFLLRAALPGKQIHELMLEAHEIGLEVVVGIRSEEDLHELDLDHVQIIAVDNHDPDNLVTDIGTSLRLRQVIPPPIAVISENGINTETDIRQLKDHGIHGAVLDESFFEEDHPGKVLIELLHHINGWS